MTMAPKRDDGPSLILRVAPGRIVPAASIDAETLAGFRIGTELNATVLRTPPSPALRAWWALLGAVVKVDDRWPSARALSNSILISCNCYEEELLLGGGVRRTPMSLRDFTEKQLLDLIEWAKLIISTEIMPGVNIEEMMGKRR